MKDRNFRNCLAHYGLGQYLSESDLIDDDVLKGLTNKAFNMNYSNAIKKNALYLLDEPENSLSAALQMKLKSFLEDSARFYHCQFIISTHSPFLLSMQGAKIYDLDSDPIGVKPWTELENVKTYYGFFKSHEKEFF